MWTLDIGTYQGSLETAGVRMIITHLMMFPLRSPEVEEIISTSEFILILESGERISTTVLQYYSITARSYSKLSVLHYMLYQIVQWGKNVF